MTLIRDVEARSAKVSLAVIAIVVIAINVAATSAYWTKKESQWYRMHTGLYKVTLGPGVSGKLTTGDNDVSAYMGKELIKQFSPPSRHGAPEDLSMDEFVERMCDMSNIPGVSENICRIFSNLQASSTAVFVGLRIGTTLLIAGAILVWYHDFRNSCKRAKQYAVALLASGSFIMVLAVVQYLVVSYRVNSLPPQTKGRCIGSAARAALALSLLSTFPGIIFAIMSREAKEEGSSLKKMAEERPDLTQSLADEQDNSKSAYGAV